MPSCWARWTLRFFRLLFGDLTRLLTVTGHAIHLPSLRHIPLLFTLNLSGIVVHSLSLEIGIIIARIPNAIAVVVYESTHIILARLDKSKEGLMVLHMHLLHRRIATTQQLNDGQRVVIKP